MASDARDAVAPLAVGSCRVELDDRHDSDLVNRGLAADAGYRGTFGHEAESDLDELRQTFRRKAHTGAMERALTALLQAGGYHVVGYGENVDVLTVDLVSGEKSVIGNPVGFYHDLCDLMGTGRPRSRHPVQPDLPA